MKVWPYALWATIGIMMLIKFYTVLDPSITLE